MAFGPELLTGGDFEASTGIGATSVLVGPSSDYAACGPNIFNAPCGGATYALFTTNAGQVTANHVRATPIKALGSRSLAVNVSGNLTQRIVYWPNVNLVNGKTYRVGVTSAQINAPFDLGLRIDGVLILALTGPVPDSVWQVHHDQFTWNGTTGPHTVAFTSNNPTLAGNDHAFDDFTLRMFDPETDCECKADIVCYSLPGDCGAPSQRRLVPPGMSVPVLTRNTSGQAINHGATVAAVGDPFPDLVNGFISGAFTNEQMAFLVATPNGGTFAWLDMIQLNLNIIPGADGPRRMLGFGYWNGYGSVLNDGDGLGDIVVHLFDAGNMLIGGSPVALPNVNNQLFHAAALPTPTALVDHVELHMGSKPFPGSINANMREIAPVWAYRSAVDWRCFGRTVTAIIDYTGTDISTAVQQEGTASGAMMVAGSGITVTPTNLNQTNGPHTMTFSSNGPFTGTIVTNNPGNFSSLTVSDTSPVITVTGNANNTFEIDWSFPGVQGAAIHSAIFTGGQYIDLATGLFIDPTTINIVPCT